MSELSQAIGETVDLSVLKGQSAVITGQIEGHHRLRSVSAVGESFPLYCTANEKRFSAFSQTNGLTNPAKRAALLQTLQEVLGTARARSVPAVATRDDLLRGRQVLLAEDNVVNQKLAGRLLEKLGADVTIAKDGQAAIDQLLARPFYVVLMDCQMPVLDGYEATRRIRAGVAGRVAAAT
jgi:PleD family two-component response regulator